MPIENDRNFLRRQAQRLNLKFQHRGVLHHDYIGHLDYRSPPEEVQMPARILPKLPFFKPEHRYATQDAVIV
jgi:hypothetical protein